MELKQLLKHIARRIKILLLITICGFVISAVIVYNLPPTYSASMTLYVEKASEVSDSGDYTFDGYYAQQAVEGYTDTIVGLFESPDSMALALSRLEVDVERNIKNYTHSLKVEKVAPQIVLVTVTRKDRTDAIEVGSELSTVVSDKVALLNREDGPHYTLVRVEEAPLVSVNTLPEIVVVVASGILALMLGLFGVLFELYLREDD